MLLRSRKPLTRKDAAAINEWRFSKLKEHRDRNIEVENEAFDRYMENINLLEEAFSVKSIMDGSNEDESSVDIIEKLNKGRSDEDPTSFLKLKSQLHNLHTKSSETETEEDMASKEQTEKNDVALRKKSGYILRKLFTTTEMDQETLNSVDGHFSSLEKIEDL